MSDECVNIKLIDNFLLWLVLVAVVLPISTSIYLSLYLFIYLSTYLAFYLPACLSIYLAICVCYVPLLSLKLAFFDKVEASLF